MKKIFMDRGWEYGGTQKTQKRVAIYAPHPLQIFHDPTNQATPNSTPVND
jgi:hypothetical protein